MKNRIEIVENILSANDRLALENRQRLDEANLFSINVMASPGAGKTSLIERTISVLNKQYQIAMVNGDIATHFDADRAAAAGATAVQINTGGDCHLDAMMFRNALDKLDLEKYRLLIVENVGNLVCPASFQLGTHKNVLVASLPEGDDKPYKYPAMYRGTDVLVINKIDLLPYVTFDFDFFRKGVEVLNPGVQILPLSCKTLEGFDQWVSWLSSHIING
jgi:hydrogenase nickel incorporation protein HypB